MGALVRDASVSARQSPPASIWALALPEGAGERQVAWVNAVQRVRSITEGRAATIVQRGGPGWR